MNSADGDSLVAEAKKTANTKSFFGFGENKLGKAADLFGQAGNAYKLKKQCMGV